MNISITWDLFILAFFVMMVAYNFIIGKNRSLKIILSTYLAILAADGIGNLFAKYLGESKGIQQLMSLFSFGPVNDSELGLKIFVFVIVLVILVVKGGFRVHVGDEFTGMTGVAVLLIYGFLSACLVLSALIVFITGGSFIELYSLPQDPAAFDFYQNSRFAKILVEYHDLWFVLPAFAFLFTSFLSDFNDSQE